MKSPLKHAFELLFVPLAAAVIFVEQVLIRVLNRITAAIARWAPVAAIEAWLVKQPPWVALVAFVMPSILILPIKLSALFFAAHHQFVLAVAAVRDGVRELLLSTEQSDTHGVLVAVRDSGPGIETERRQHVFDAFYTTKSSGVGMGLSICRSIIGVHGGRLWVDENAPRGAVFQFTLPIAERNS